MRHRSKLLAGCVMGVPIAEVNYGGRVMYRMLPPAESVPVGAAKRWTRSRSLLTLVIRAAIAAERETFNRLTARLAAEALP